MTRFLYLADTHIGAESMGYQMQQGYPARAASILDALRDWIRDDGRIDLVLHGGDMADTGSREHIRCAAGLFDLGCPVRLCLGNHDLTTDTALRDWLDLAPAFFAAGDPTFTVACADCVVHVSPNQWCDEPYVWRSRQDPHFLAGQMADLEARLARHTDRVHILATHYPPRAVPTAQTGEPAPAHATPASFGDVFAALARRRPNLRCVLAAHSHVNTHIVEQGVHYVTTSALVEAPFEFKLFEVGNETVRMTTHTLLDRVPFPARYDFDRTFVQGRRTDRAFTDGPNGLDAGLDANRQ